jgi:putative tryptophan/tyrosine transport system substrate-binding protein
MRLIGLAVILTLPLMLPPAGEAQPAGKTARMGSLNVGPAPSPEELARSRSTSPFWQAMKDLGWVYGQNIVAEGRYGESPDQLRAAAADLVRLKVDVLYALSASLATLLQLETRTIPIVVGAAGSDLAAIGLVASLARPGGNLTGVQVLNSDLIPKKLEFLQALVPNLSRIAFLKEDVSVPQTFGEHDRSLAAAARTLNLNVNTVTVHGPGEFAAAFLAMTKNRDQGLLVLGSPFSIQHRKQIVELAAKHRIVAIYENEVSAEAGGLMSYAANREEIAHRQAVFVDKILRGAKPADLPVEQPTKFKFVINLTTAKALGLTIPQSLLGRADRVIE